MAIQKKITEVLSKTVKIISIVTKLVCFLKVSTLPINSIKKVPCNSNAVFFVLSITVKVNGIQKKVITLIALSIVAKYVRMV